MEMQPKMKFIIGGLVGMLIFILLITVLLVNSKNPKKTENPTEESKTNETGGGFLGFLKPTTTAGKKIQTIIIGEENNGLTNLQVAGKALSCLNNMRDERGAYLLEKKCDGSTKTCEKVDVNHSGPRPIWGSFKYYQKTKNNSELLKLKNDLSINTEKIPTIQNDFWNCKLMSEMYMSDIFSATEKQEIYNICVFSLLQPSLITKADESIKLGSVKKPNFDEVKNRTFSVNTNGLSAQEADLSKSSYYASEFVGQFFLTKEEKELQRALFFYNNALKNYVSQKTYRFGELCELGEASLDLYIATEDADYLSFATYVWNKENINQIGVKNEFSNLNSKATCAFFANSLSKITKETLYEKVKNDILNLTIRFNLDYANYANSFMNDGCFTEKASGTYTKNSKENGLLVGILSQ